MEYIILGILILAFIINFTQNGGFKVVKVEKKEDGFTKINENVCIKVEAYKVEHIADADGCICNWIRRNQASGYCQKCHTSWL